jgi:phosphate/sulfate permease
MAKAQPHDSQIEVHRDLSTTTYTWRDLSKRRLKLGTVVGTIVTACAIIVTEISLVYTLIKESSNGQIHQGLLIASIIVGLIAVIYVWFTYFVILNPKRKPFKLTLSPGKLKYELGYLNIDFSNYEKATAQIDNVSALFKKTKLMKSEIETSDITNLKLEQIAQTKRLSFDYQAERIEIGESLSDADREWLYEILRDHLAK